MPRAATPVDNFDEAIKELTPAGLPFMTKVTFGAAGAIASAIPCYLYYSNFFSLEASYAAVYMIVMGVCTALLYLTNVKTCEKEFARVMERKKKFGEEMNETVGRTEAAAYSIFMNNLIFVAVVALLSFVIFPRLGFNLPTYLMFAASSILAAVFTFGCGYDYI